MRAWVDLMQVKEFVANEEDLVARPTYNFRAYKIRGGKAHKRELTGFVTVYATVWLYQKNVIVKVRKGK